MQFLRCSTRDGESVAVAQVGVPQRPAQASSKGDETLKNTRTAREAVSGHGRFGVFRGRSMTLAGVRGRPFRSDRRRCWCVSRWSAFRASDSRRPSSGRSARRSVDRRVTCRRHDGSGRLRRPIRSRYLGGEKICGNWPRSSNQNSQEVGHPRDRRGLAAPILGVREVPYRSFGPGTSSRRRPDDSRWSTIARDFNRVSRVKTNTPPRDTPAP